MVPPIVAIPPPSSAWLAMTSLAVTSPLLEVKRAPPPAPEPPSLPSHRVRVIWTEQLVAARPPPPAARLAATTLSRSCSELALQETPPPLDEVLPLRRVSPTIRTPAPATL